nr:immunoglobulin light chain junction region [Macaca mulatta]MOX28092.1 immunoglobulin light chain junction region [Macaca mulatta]MOX28313.1 immunoglobulin light chain junction region [Macaca mulatta]MOX28394.1 immunoglobulin light chain junction region [Macaca mulatta]MOX28570.1 immunoglobulin light chain junction region [Macaca mulatta]
DYYCAIWYNSAWVF